MKFTVKFLNIFYRDFWTASKGGPVNLCLSVCPSVNDAIKKAIELVN